MPTPLFARLRESLSNHFTSPRSRAARRPAARRNLGFESLETREMLSVSSLTDLSVSANTGEKPQSKVWEYNGQWWTVMPNSSGTWLWQLNGTQWNPHLQLSSNSKTYADVAVAGDLAHILLYQGANSQLATVQFDHGLDNRYELWAQRPQLVNVNLGSGVETAALAVDSTGRLWIASDPGSNVQVRYSDGTYTNWSAPIIVASGIKSDDIATIAALPDGTVGVMWSNQNTKRFGFRLHVDGAAPTAWLNPEVPAAQSALSKGGGMADDHINVAVAADGTLYAAVKTSYDSSSYPKIALLVRRPSGVWDDLYMVDGSGTRPIVVLNELTRQVIVAYSASEGGSNIVYRISSMDDIAFGARQTLMSGNLNDVTSTKHSVTNEVVFLAAGGGKAKGVVFQFDTAGVDPPVVDPPPIVTQPPVNLPPAVNAGPDQTVQLIASALLIGTVSDDGNPQPASLTTNWSMVSGPGLVTFGSATVVNTTATFSAAGTYVLRLTASDGELTTVDDVTVVVTPVPNDDPTPPSSGSGGSAPPLEIAFQNGLFPFLAYAGASDTTITSSSAGANFGTATVLSINGDPDAAALLRWDVSAVPAGSIIVSAAIELNVSTSSTGNYELYALQQAWDELAATWEQYDSLSAWSAGGADGPADHDSAVLGQLNPGGSGGIYRLALNDAGLAAVQSWINNPLNNFGIIIKDYAEANKVTTVTTTSIVRKGKVQTKVTEQHDVVEPVNVIVSSNEASLASLRPKLILSFQPATDTEPQEPTEPAPPANTAPVVSAGADQTIQLPTTAALSGSVTDDGLPSAPGSVTHTWTKLSGPGTVTFANASAASTTAQFGTAGTYILRLTASDGELQSFDELTIVVQPAPPVNQPPVVSAGADQTVQLPGSATLSGSVTDDGLPSTPGSVTQSWTKVSGPGTVTFASASAASTTAQFSAAGTYVLRLTASDGQLQAFDEVTVVVIPPLVVNQPPVVSAGADQTIQLPELASLLGSVTDDALPASPGSVSLTWSTISGPGSVTFASATSAGTTAQFSAAGSYVLRLTANDGQLQSFDDVTITVLAAPPAEPDPPAEIEEPLPEPEPVVNTRKSIRTR